MQAEQFLILALIFQIKHLLADYYQQTPYMYLNKGQPIGWEIPLALHAGIQASYTFVISAGYLLYQNLAWSDILVLSFGFWVFDFVTHFVTDRWKATRKGGPDTPKFWIYLGWDQMIHHIVGLLIVYALVIVG